MRKEIVILIMVLLLISCQKKEIKINKNIPENAIAVSSYKCNLRDLSAGVKCIIEVKNHGSKDIHAEVNEKIVKVFVEANQRVSQGDTLLTLDSRSLEQQIALARLSLDKLKREHAKQRELGVLKVIESNDLQLEQSKYDLLSLIKKRRDYIIIAKGNGIIESLLVKEGDLITQGTDLLEIVYDDDITIDGYIIQAEIGKIQKGNIAKVTIPGIEQTISTEVELISNIVENGCIRVTLKSQILTKDIRSGMKGTAEIVTSSLKSRLLVPQTAVLFRDGENLVFKVEGERAKWVKVKLGASNERDIEILSGINIGDEIVIKGQKLLSHDAKIKVISRR